MQVDPEFDLPSIVSAIALLAVPVLSLVYSSLTTWEPSSDVAITFLMVVFIFAFCSVIALVSPSERCRMDLPLTYRLVSRVLCWCCICVKFTNDSKMICIPGQNHGTTAGSQSYGKTDSL